MVYFVDIDSMTPMNCGKSPDQTTITRRPGSPDGSTIVGDPWRRLYAGARDVLDGFVGPGFDLERQGQQHGRLRGFRALIRIAR